MTIRYISSVDFENKIFIASLVSHSINSFVIERLRHFSYRNNSREFPSSNFTSLWERAILTCLLLTTTTCLGRVFAYSHRIYSKKENEKNVTQSKYFIRMEHENIWSEKRQCQKWKFAIEYLSIILTKFDSVFFLTYPTVNGSNFPLKAKLWWQICCSCFERKKAISIKSREEHVRVGGSSGEFHDDFWLLLSCCGKRNTHKSSSNLRDWSAKRFLFPFKLLCATAHLAHISILQIAERKD